MEVESIVEQEKAFQELKSKLITHQFLNKLMEWNFLLLEQMLVMQPMEQFCSKGRKKENTPQNMPASCFPYQNAVTRL